MKRGNRIFYLFFPAFLFLILTSRSALFADFATDIVLDFSQTKLNFVSPIDGQFLFKFKATNNGSVTYRMSGSITCDKGFGLPNPQGRPDLRPGDSAWYKYLLPQVQSNVPGDVVNLTLSVVLDCEANPGSPITFQRNLTITTIDGNLPGSVTLYGTIKDENGNPLPNVGLIIKANNAHTMPHSDNNGFFSFSIAPSPFYWIIAHENGYDTAYQYVDGSQIQNPYNLVLRKTVPRAFNFTLINSLQGNTGSWRISVTKDESRVLFANGCENWLDMGLRSQSKIFLFDTDTGNKLWEQPMGWDAYSFDISDDGSYCVFATNGAGGIPGEPQTNYVRLLNGNDGSTIWTKYATIAEFPGMPTINYATTCSRAVKFSHGGDYILVGLEYDFAYLLDRSTGSIRWQKRVGENVREIVFTRDDRYVYVPSGGGYVYKLDVSNGNEIWRQWAGSWASVDGFALSPDENYLLVGTKSGDLTVINTDSGLIKFHKEYDGAVARGRFTPDGTKVIGSAGSGGIHCYDLEGNELWSSWESTSMSFPSHGRWFVCARNQGTVVSTQGTILYSVGNGGDLPSMVAWVNSAGTRFIYGRHDASTYNDTVLKFYKVEEFSPAAITLSRTRLDYGAIAGGVVTKSQTVILGNSGGGTLNWTATPDQSWLSVAPASGTGTAALVVTVDPTGLGAGAWAGTITVADTAAATNPRRTISAYLTVKNAETSALPFGEFSTPLDGTTGITGAIPVTGWVVDDIETTKVEIWRDPAAGEGTSLVYIGDAIFVEGARPDIETGYPGFPYNYRAGWGYMLLTNFLPGQGNGIFKIHAFATDKEGNQVLLGTKTITCDNAHAVKPFGTIDTPGQGGDTSGNPFVNFGWVLTPMLKTVSKDGSTIDVYVDSVKVGNLSTAPNVYNQYRVDVTTAFPGLNNSSGPVGAFYLDTTKYANGVHTIYWIATDDASAADGIGSRYFNILNTGTATMAGSEAINLEKADSYKSVISLPPSFDPIRAKRGFDLKEEPEVIQPDNYGILNVEIKEVDRVEIDLGKAKAFKGYQVVGEELRSLPIGSTLDTKEGTFSWMPGPGFLGTYDLIFIREDGSGMTKRIPVKVTIRPKFEKH